MFAVETINENGFDIICLKDQVNAVTVEIIPACGAILHAFKVEHDGKMLNIIDSYSNKKQFDESLESSGFKSAKLSPFVCRMKEGSYHFGDKDYTVEKFFLGKHALHGIIYDAAFSVIKTTANEDAASVELIFSYKGTDPGYPFKYDCRVIYELKKNASLGITTAIKNHESTAIPVTDGWHPYFSFGKQVDKLLLSIQCNEMLEFDDELIPTKNKIPFTNFRSIKPIGDIKLDNSFLVDFTSDNVSLLLRDKERKLQLEIQPERSYPILQVYIPDHRNSIAIENLSGAPDAFNNGIGLTVLAAGSEVVFRTNYTIRSVD